MCFDFPIINIRGCGEDASSRYYLQDLHAISIENIAAYVDQERVRAKQLIRDLEKVAAEDVIDEYFYKLREKLNVNEQCGLARFGGVGYDFKDDCQYAVKMELDCIDRHTYGRNRISCIRFYASEHGYADIYVIDGANAHHKVIEVDAGLNIIDLDIDVSNNKIEIQIEGCPLVIGEGDECGCYYERDCSKYYISTSKLVGCDWKPFNFDGIEVEMLTILDKCEMIKNVKERLYKAILYKLGIMLLHEWKVSNRCNILAVEGVRKADMALSYLEGGEDPQTGYERKGKYNEYMTNLIEGSYKLFNRTSFTDTKLIHTTKSF